MTDRQDKSGEKSRNFIAQFFSTLGPGLITGAADDDPSGIATYSIAGAQMGTGNALDCVHQWCARAIFARWSFDCCVRPQTNAGRAKLVVVTHRGRNITLVMFGAAAAMFLL